MLQRDDIANLYNKYPDITFDLLSLTFISTVFFLICIILELIKFRKDKQNLVLNLYANVIVLCINILLNLVYFYIHIILSASIYDMTGYTIILLIIMLCCIPTFIFTILNKVKFKILKENNIKINTFYKDLIDAILTFNTILIISIPSIVLLILDFDFAVKHTYLLFPILIIIFDLIFFRKNIKNLKVSLYINSILGALILLCNLIINIDLIKFKNLEYILFIIQLLTISILYIIKLNIFKRYEVNINRYYKILFFIVQAICLILIPLFLIIFYDLIILEKFSVFEFLKTVILNNIIHSLT